MRSYEIGDKSKSATIHMLVGPAWKARVEAYAKRRKITMSEAIRQLVEAGLDAASGEKDRN
jgi:hypothetical protein